MARQSQRQSASARKTYETLETQGRAADIRNKLEEEKENQRQSAARKKELQAELKELGPVTTNRRTKKPRVVSAPVTKPANISQSSSSGRVTTTSRRASSGRITALESLPTPNAAASIPASIPEVQPMQVVEPLLNDRTS